MTSNADLFIASDSAVALDDHLVAFIADESGEGVLRVLPLVVVDLADGEDLLIGCAHDLLDQWLDDLGGDLRGGDPFFAVILEEVSLFVGEHSLGGGRDADRAAGGFVDERDTPFALLEPMDIALAEGASGDHLDAIGETGGTVVLADLDKGDELPVAGAFDAKRVHRSGPNTEPHRHRGALVPVELLTGFEVILWVHHGDSPFKREYQFSTV